MKKAVKMFVLLSSVFLLIIVTSNKISAQTLPDPTTDPDQGIPLDGGLSLLVAAGIGYGVKKVRDNRKKKNIVPLNN